MHAMRVRLWIRALRAPFFQAVLVPLLLGTAAAWYHTGEFYLGYFLLAMVAVVSVHAGTNLTNDYFDHKSGADALNKEFTRFSGGSRVIQEGLIAPETIFRVAVSFFGLAALIGLYLVYSRGCLILAIGVVGIASGYFYTASPVKLGYRGWGEFIVGLNCGPLVTMGAYFVQSRDLNPAVLLSSVPVGYLVAAILYVNQFPDSSSDRAVNKVHLVARMRPEKAIKGYYVLIISAYSVTILGCALRIIPWMCLFSLLTVPLAWRTARAAGKNYATGSGKQMLPAMAGTVALHLSTGLLLSGGYLVAGILK